MVDLREYLRVLRERKWVILLVAALALGVAAGWTALQQSMYAAEAKVQVLPVVNPLASSQSLFNALEPDLNTETTVAQSTVVASIARTSLHTPTPAPTLLERLSVDAAGQGSVMTITYSASDPDTAARYANAFAEAYLNYRRSTVIDPLRRRIDDAESEIGEIVAELSRTESEGGRVELRLRLLSAKGSLQKYRSAIELTQGGAVIQAGVSPSSPSSPTVARNLILGLAMGLLIGAAVAFFLEGLDVRVKGPEELESRLDTRVLGSIPRHPRSSRREKGPLLWTITAPRGSGSEAYRKLGIAMERVAAERNARTIMITSPLSGSGKSTVTANLGAVLAQAGRRVVIVSADLRIPKIHEFFGLSNDIGLSNALSDSMDPSQVLRETDIKNLAVINAGPEPENPPILLAGTRTRDFIELLKATDLDFILLDTPASLTASDAGILAPLVDGALFVWNAEDSAGMEMVQARVLIERAGAPIIGAVYNMASGGEMDYHQEKRGLSTRLRSLRLRHLLRGLSPNPRSSSHTSDP